jgi:hypothetical protein
MVRQAARPRLQPAGDGVYLSPVDDDGGAGRDNVGDAVLFRVIPAGIQGSARASSNTVTSSRRTATDQASGDASCNQPFREGRRARTTRGARGYRTQS